MSISNSIDFTVTSDEIITEALELLGVLGEGETPTADQIISSRRTLNMMTKTWQADGLNLFAVERTYLFPQQGVAEYDLYKPAGDLVGLTPGLQNLYTNGTVGEGCINVTIANGPGYNRKVILAICGDDLLNGSPFEPVLDGVIGSFVEETLEEGNNSLIYEWLDVDLPDTPGNYGVSYESDDITEVGLSVVYGEGFLQQVASQTGTAVTFFSETVNITLGQPAIGFLMISACGSMTPGETMTAINPEQVDIISSTTVPGKRELISSYSEFYDFNFDPQVPVIVQDTHLYQSENPSDKTMAAALFPVIGVGDFGFTRFVKDFYTMTLASDASSGAGSVSVVDDGGLAQFENFDKIGIHLPDNTIFWTTAFLTPGGPTTLGLDMNLPQDVQAGSKIYAYTFSTDAAERPMLILEGYYQVFGSANEIPLDLISRRDYFTLSTRSSRGITNQLYYDPQIGIGELNIWPTVNDEKDYILLLVQRTLSDFDNSLDNPDYPQEWYQPLSVNLAKHLAPKYGIPQMDYARILQQARELYDMARDFDTEIYTSLYIKPDTWGNDLP